MRIYLHLPFYERRFITSQLIHINFHLYLRYKIVLKGKILSARLEIRRVSIDIKLEIEVDCDFSRGNRAIFTEGTLNNSTHFRQGLNVRPILLHGFAPQSFWIERTCFIHRVTSIVFSSYFSCDRYNEFLAFSSWMIRFLTFGIGNFRRHDFQIMVSPNAKTIIVNNSFF